MQAANVIHFWFDALTDKQHVVKGKSLTNLHGILLAGDCVWRFALSRDAPECKANLPVAARVLPPAKRRLTLNSSCSSAFRRNTWLMRITG